ncbi:hypothetical protein AGABI2DRAFT_196220 [Agaricus bisporus var. bisporus H97]|uniref:hypothetical protein n=1 Tax=Agaricus bisporus var. bisporus (strain H97 / ATCC MYA-4626 / FGSC 10389) TaxID=936046 RepID=UPI00029F670A|nr:hypothetical protein AGABI2DRAFT_196220 [Agaricus bisporus var. bisporus H97]EKV41729.1 hypothetical protein AGABI2DRAFT_196220 [Agaricus bisporus var. bisporus H97]
MAFRILAGGYDNFVATYLFDPQSSSLSVASRSTTGINPSWLTGHPTNASIFYATNENADGGLQSFTINSDGSLVTQDTVSSGGDSPAFAVALSTGQVAVMNYNTGNGRVVPTNEGLVFEQNAAVEKFPLENSTSVSHPHMALEHGGEIYVPDLGQDKIWRLVQNGSNPSSFVIHGSLPHPLGSGPRHIAIHEDRLFTIHELSSTLTVQAVPASLDETTQITSSVSIIPPDQPQGSQFAAAEILIPSPTSKFPTPYIYVSNRNIGRALDPRGDSIAIFELVNKGTQDESLQLVNQIFTGLTQIRGMEFGPSSQGGEDFLIAAGVVGDAGTVVLQRTDGGRNMTVVSRNADIPTRTSFLWI